jgi:hypothetical protein
MNVVRDPTTVGAPQLGRLSEEQDNPRQDAPVLAPGFVPEDTEASSAGGHGTSSAQQASAHDLAQQQIPQPTDARLL